MASAQTTTRIRFPSVDLNLRRRLLLIASFTAIEAEGFTPADAEFFPINGGVCIHPQNSFFFIGCTMHLNERMRSRASSHRAGEFTLHFGGRAILEFDQLALVRGGGIFRRIQHSRIATFHMGFEFFEAKVDRIRIDDNVDGAGLRDRLQSGAVELAAPHRHPAEMIRFEAWMSVLRVYLVCGRAAAAQWPQHKQLQRQSGEGFHRRPPWWRIAGRFGTLTRHATRLLRPSLRRSADAPRTNSTVVRFFHEHATKAHR